MHGIEEKTKESHHKKEARKKSIDEQFAMVQPKEVQAEKMETFIDTATIREFLIWIQTIKGGKPKQENNNMDPRPSRCVGREGDDATTPLQQ